MSNFISNATSRGTQPRITKTQQVRTLITLRPLMTNKQIAEQLECDLSLVYQLRKGMLAPAPKPPKATDKVAPPKATDKVAPSNNVVKNKPVAVIKEPKEPTIKQACEVLLKAIDGIDGLDITLFANEIAFDLDGTKYVCPPSEVDRLLSAFKTIDSFVA
jgi:hypothetical protein